MPLPCPHTQSHTLEISQVIYLSKQICPVISDPAEPGPVVSGQSSVSPVLKKIITFDN